MWPLTADPERADNGALFEEVLVKRSSGPRKTAKLSDSVNQHLNLYALVAGAAGVSLLSLTQPAEAKIVYTPAHIKITLNHKFLLDLNHDGIKDFELNNNSAHSSAFLEAFPRQTGNALAAATGGMCNPVLGAAALKAGVLIGKGQTFGDYDCMAQKLATEGSFGSWGNVKNRFLGLQFVIKGKKHFGWARLSVSKPPYIAILTGYAYETIPNKPIIAGKTHGRNRVTVQPASLGHLAGGANSIPAWRVKPVAATTH